MIRIVVLDISGMYSQIYDEVYCKEDTISEVLNRYKGYLCIKIRE